MQKLSIPVETPNLIDLLTAFPVEPCEMVGHDFGALFDGFDSPRLESSFSVCEGGLPPGLFQA